jgi:adenylate cyclase
MKKKTEFKNRIDFEVDIEVIDETSGLYQFKIQPRKDRYEWKEIEGEKRLYDKLDNVIFPKNIKETIKEFIEKAPWQFELPDRGVLDIKEYISSRLGPIKERALGTRQKHNTSDKSSEFLESMTLNEHEFAVLSIDIIGSTTLSQKVVLDNYIRIIDTFVYEMSSVVPKYNGHVLKYQGDGFIAYFPAPSFIVKTDFAFDCAMLMRSILIQGINPVFKELGLPRMGMRIGIESGAANVHMIGSEATKRHVDIIGDVINLAVKIQGCADPNGICVGDVALRNLFTPRRLMCKQIVSPKGWKYVDYNGEPYKVYKVILDK